MVGNTVTIRGGSEGREDLVYKLLAYLTQLGWYGIDGKARGDITIKEYPCDSGIEFRATRLPEVLH